jgi:hypothetical protein
MTDAFSAEVPDSRSTLLREHRKSNGRDIYHSNAALTALEHDPEKCAAVFRKDHAQSKS